MFLCCGWPKSAGPEVVRVRIGAGSAAIGTQGGELG